MFNKGKTDSEIEDEISSIYRSLFVYPRIRELELGDLHIFLPKPRTSTSSTPFYFDPDSNLRIENV
jgi:hypothetical protein